MGWIHSPDGTVLDKVLPATSAMRLTVHLRSPHPPITTVRWSAETTTLGTTAGPGGRLDLRPAALARAQHITAVLTLTDGSTTTVTKRVRLIAATEADEARYAPPPPLPLEASGCVLARADLETITPAEAARRSDLSGTLITGPIGAAAGRTGENFIVEARGPVGDRRALIGADRGNDGASFRHVTVTGLERDPEGQPVRLHEVDRLVLGSAMTLEAADISWGNDGWGMGSNARLMRSHVHSHTYFTLGAVTRHRDGCQVQQGGGQQVVDCTFDNDTPAWPVTSSGQRVASVKTAPAPASASLMINHDRAITGGIVFTGNLSRGGSSVHLNISGGNRPRLGETYPDGLAWYAERSADQRPRLLVLGNRSAAPPQHGVVRAPGPWLRQIAFPHARSWEPSGQDMGASPCFSVLEPAPAGGGYGRLYGRLYGAAGSGGSQRHLRRNEILSTTG